MRAGASRSFTERCSPHPRVPYQHCGLGKSRKSPRRVFPRHSSREHHDCDRRPGFSRDAAGNRSGSNRARRKAQRKVSGMAEAGKRAGLPPSLQFPPARTPNGGGHPSCAPLFSAPLFWLASSPLSSSPLSSFSWRPVFLRLSSPASLAPFSWPAPFGLELSWPAPSCLEARSGCRHHPMELRAQGLPQVPVLAARESRRLPLRERVLLPLLPLLPNPLPAIRRRRRCRCTHPSHRLDHTGSDHRSAYLLLRICGPRTHSRTGPGKLGLLAAKLHCVCVTARDYSTDSFTGSIVHSQ